MAKKKTSDNEEQAGTPDGAGEAKSGKAKLRGDDVGRGRFDFMGTRKKGYILSLILCATAIASISIRGMNWGIDFQGGSVYWYCFEDAEKASTESIRKHFLDVGGPGTKVTVQRVESTDQVSECGGVEASGEQVQYLIFTGFHEVKAEDDPIPKVEARFDNELGGATQLRSREIGPTIGEAIKADAVKALLLAVAGMLLYVGVRFEFRWGLAAVLALIHDCLIVIGIFSLFGREVNSDSLAALLTIIGYSLNDTIVIIDRVRENMGVHSIKRKLGYEGVFNLSINQSITRTLNTSITTLFPVTALLLFGGLVIRDFALALFIGVLAGTYSSIWVVSAVLVDWYYREHPAVAEKARAKAEA